MEGHAPGDRAHASEDDHVPPRPPHHAVRVAAVVLGLALVASAWPLPRARRAPPPRPGPVVLVSELSPPPSASASSAPITR